MNSVSLVGKSLNEELLEEAQRGFARLLRRLVTLYTHGESSSLSEFEMRQLTESLMYVLSSKLNREDVLVGLVKDADVFYEQRLSSLEQRMDNVLEAWQRICATMPPIRNVSLRDTLASIGNLKHLYDIRFAAHEVPCDIQYQLSIPVDDSLQGLDYLESWLAQLRRETEWIAQFTVESCIAVLEDACPDYRGLHVNLYELLHMQRGELVKRA